MKLLIALLVLALIGLAEGQYSEDMYYDYSVFASQQFSTEIWDGDSQTINFRGINYKTLDSPTSDYDVMYMSVFSPNLLPLLEAPVYPFSQNCTAVGGIGTYIPTGLLTGNVQFIPVYSDAYRFDYLLQVAPFDNSQYTTSLEESESISFSFSCVVQAHQDLVFTFMSIQERTPFEAQLYSTPNTAIDELISNSANTVASVIDLFMIFLMLAQFILFLFLFVSVWKLVEHIWIRIQKNREM